MADFFGYVTFALALAGAVAVTGWGIWQIIREKRLTSRSIAQVFYGTALLFLVRPATAEAPPEIRADGVFWVVVLLFVIGALFDLSGKSRRAGNL